MSKVNSLKLSMPQSRTVRGCVINRAPLGAFLEAIQVAEEFLPKMVETIFPQMSLQEILLAIRSSNSDFLGQILTRALLTVPGQVITLVSQLTMIPEKKLTEDPIIGLDGLAEIADAWYEVNRIESFFVNALGLLKKLRAQKENPTTTGFST